MACDKCYSGEEVIEMFFNKIGVSGALFLFLVFMFPLIAIVVSVLHLLVWPMSYYAPANKPPSPDSDGYIRLSEILKGYHYSWKCDSENHRKNKLKEVAELNDKLNIVMSMVRKESGKLNEMLYAGKIVEENITKQDNRIKELKRRDNASGDNHNAKEISLAQESLDMSLRLREKHQGSVRVSKEFIEISDRVMRLKAREINLKNDLGYKGV